MKAEDVKPGAVVEFDFGKGKKQGTVLRLFQKSVYLSVDFPNHKGKIIKRKIDTLFGEKGTKANPGKLYGVKSHIWSALALAVTYADKEGKDE